MEEKKNPGRDMEWKIERGMHNVEWLNPDNPLMSGDHIAFREEGVLVWGVVTFTPRTLTVTMRVPVEAPAAQETIEPEFPVIFRTDPKRESPASPMGIDRARRLILRLYYSFGKTV